MYQWDAGGFNSISDGLVRSWFTTSTYFNLSRFDQAFASYNPKTNSYDLHLAAAGSSSEDRWVSFCLSNQKWYGPHKTDAFTPSMRVLSRNSSNTDTAYLGGTNGFLHTMNADTRTDDSATAIDFDCRMLHCANTPRIEKTWEQPDILTQIESGGDLTVTPTVGGLDAVASSAMLHDLTLGRETLGYIGLGRFLQMRYRENTVGQDLLIYGIEIPYGEWGKM